MNFTKNELRVINPGYRKKIRIVLWTGILVIFFAIAFCINGYVDIRNINNFLKTNCSYVNKMPVNSGADAIKLKAVLVENAAELRQARIGRLEEGLFDRVSFFVFIGVIFIAFYIVGKKYLKIIEKLQKEINKLNNNISN